MGDRPPTGTAIELRFPLGSYNSQSASSFSHPEWPPHPVRVMAALVSAAAALAPDEAARARRVIRILCEAAQPPLIVAPRAGSGADGRDSLASLQGASRWAPRNHELGELSAGLHPRDLGRGRAAISKGGVAIGDLPVQFVWPVSLEDEELEALARAAAEMTFLGTSRSPILARVCAVREVSTAPSWVPDREDRRAAVDVRVPTATLLETLDAVHERRKAAPRRDGSPARAPFIPPASLGRWQRYVHTSELASEEPAVVDPQQWGDMLVLAVDAASQIRPKAPAAYSLARATRAALLATYDEAGSEGEAPPVLRARQAEAHAAFISLPFVGQPNADGRIIGIAIVLPHPSRAPDVLFQRRGIERGIRALITIGRDGQRASVGVPGLGDVVLGSQPPRRTPPLTLQPARWRSASRRWGSVTPVVHSRFRRSGRLESLLEQVSADCRDVGAPAPVEVELLRTSRFHGAPSGILRRGLPENWRGLLKGPVDHVELTFAEPVEGPLLLGRARHFGLGLCLPLPETT
jgi:CRISPR-associated protein Csb2